MPAQTIKTLKFKAPPKFRVEKVENQDSVLLAMANAKIVSIDSFQRLIANTSYVYPDELNATEIFLFHNNSDGSISLKSKGNGLFVCLDVDFLFASCNESVSDQNREKFKIQCFSHLGGLDECKVFTLRSIGTNKLVTIGEGDGLLRVSF